MTKESVTEKLIKTAKRICEVVHLPAAWSFCNVFNDDWATLSTNSPSKKLFWGFKTHVLLRFILFGLHSCSDCYCRWNGFFLASDFQ